MRLDDAHRLRGVRHPLGHHQRDCKRSVPSGDRCNRGYPFHHCLLWLHPLVIHPLTLTGRRRRTLVQYDYRHPIDRELFSCVKPTLDECRAARDKWLNAKKGKEDRL
ncbi:DUF3873 domain-containing protein [Bacteroides uniformis]|nr:DUF3873 domain-containing protein [Bacteroides uniformis]KAB3915221.1 DUF3873 domain-containing protein [Bacteroides uniformis]KAB3917471.1 DUF3873 domain-containing protein [Bacteroides uniformis]KAB3921432.1 DUF3873 domain-containing protein [Bacteroides uniformis]KAB3928014.1 DUF3873 domain-containing protein [Bacteroides uniformis]